MTQKIIKADEIIDYSFLLLPHIVCADGQIHNKETQALHELAQQSNMGKRTIEEMEKILAQDENLLSVEDVANKILPDEQNQVMRQILAIAYVDGFFSPLEREMVYLVAEIWNFTKEEVEGLIEQAEGLCTSQTIDHEEKEQQKISFGARLLKGAESVVSRKLVDKLGEIAPENVGQQIEQLRREILLAGPEYDDAIKRCATVAVQDYNFGALALKRTGLTLQDLGKGIQKQLEAVNTKKTTKGKAKTAAEVAKQLETTRKSLTVEIIKEIESVRESLAAKQRALNHFSIAFMGKTKAGKSTLHAIITDGGWDAIGEGKQRTTRFNRVYEWKNIRIIDTPGIGAPDGKTDEEIAQSIVEESDVICYVVTDDSVQETEFKSLKILKEKAKPLIILLNVKKNLRDTRRLEYFLKNPDKPFAKTGKNDLAGHVERIRRYAKQYYGNDYFDIIPVMLLAAQLSREEEYQQNKEKLLKASRMQDFLDSIRVSLVEHGAIRRSQTLLGSTVGAIDKPDKWVTQQIQIYQQLIETLKNKQKTTKKNIRKATNDNCDYLSKEIKTIFKEAFDAIPQFSRDNWNADETTLNIKWDKKIQSLKFDERLKNVFQESSTQFQNEIQEILEEVGNELQLLVKLTGGDFKFTQQDSISFKNLLRIGGNVLLVAGTVLTFFAPPIGIAIGIVGTAIGFITGLFKSKEEKQREAADKIEDSLSSQLDDYQYKTLQEAEKEFKKYCNNVENSVNDYFEELIAGLEGITTELNTAKTKLDNNINYLNRAYAKRIIDWCLGKYEPLNDSSIIKTIAKVKRDFGKNMNIQTKTEIKINKSQEEINLVLQEDISINPTDLKPINETNLFN
ncbi:MAG: 50S ribosome-binding GTPase [Rivularia sp. (in: Bacteria)]|nr:50S ribosome-binding GTPase [Rivularia sp. MS3]